MNRSGCWCHWCNLSPSEWENNNHEKGILWTIDLMKKSLNEQFNNNNMTANENKGINQPLVFDTVPIEICIFSLLHVEIGVGNKIVENYFLWITERMEKYLKKKLL